MISILCVDDEQDLLEVAQIFLEESGEFNVEISTSAQEALNFASIAAYDAIVSDYLMPGMNGIEFLKEIRRRCGDIPFILFTGRGREEIVIDAINNGADFYLQKGGDPEAQFAELTHKIRQAVAWRRAEHQRTESEKRLLDIINFLPDATFAIDRSGQVISWNRAMEEMTGRMAGEMLGKGEYEYAVPFYGMRRPMLIDLVFAPQDEVRQRYASVHIDKEILTGETIDATPQGKTCILWGMAAPLYDNEGALVGAIESIRNITARRQAEEALRRSEQTLRINEERLVMAQEIGQIGSWEYTLNTDTIWGSAEGLRIFGFPPVAGELPIAAIEACIPDRDRVHQALVDLITKGDAYNLEYGIHPADGSPPRVIHAIGRLERDAGGNLIRIRGVIQDITARRKTEEALRESEAKFRRLAENAPDMIYRMSLPSGTYEYISPASLALTGYTPEEFYADPSIVKTLIHPAWREYFHRQWASILRGEVPPFYEYQIIDRAGTTRWINQRNMVIRNDRGQVVTVEGIVTDTTRQKEIERELKRNELRSLAVSENIGFWIWEIDPDGVYRYSSPAIRHILGFAPEELVGTMHFYDLFDAGVREELKATALAAFESREPFRNFVNLNRHKNGTPVLLSTSGTPMFDENGVFSGYCGVDENITERTATQSAFQTIVRSMVGTTGITALHQITKSVSSWLGVPCVMVGEIQPDNQTVKVLSMLLDGGEVPGYSYTLKGTPCDNVAEKGFCLYEDNVRQLFPLSKDLVDLNIRGYIGTPMRNSAGKVFGILCALSRTPLPVVPALQDIMDIIAVKAAAELERMQMERALTENRQMLAKAMDLAHLANWEYDIASGMFTFDDRFYALYGTTAEREGGTRMPAEVYAREFVHPDESALVAEETKNAIETTDPDYTSRVEHRIIRRDGEIRTFVVSIRVRKDAEGQTISTYGANQDITEIKRAEAALRETEGRFRSLVETSPGVIWEVDTGGQFQYISPTVQSLLGYAPDELIGESVTGLVIERLQPTVLKILTNFVSSPDVPMQPFEIIARHRDGHDLVMEIRPSRVIDAHGTLTGFRGVAFDTTARKKAEEALKRTNRQLTLMSSITRHDLLNKITVILGNLKLAEKKATDPGQEEYLKKIRYATSAIKAQIEFTRIYQNLGTNEPQWLHLDSLMPRSYVPDTISLHAAVGGIRIYADPMLERVFFNLLDNAIRHGETVTEIRVSSHRSGSDLLVVWEDNGIGIAPEDKEQIFDRGFGKNTGLGLFLVREILSLTGITIRETGEPGKGVRFEIVVPQGAYEIDAGQ